MLRADAETETIEKALDIVIAECERNRSTVKANDRFITSGIDIKDAYGSLEESMQPVQSPGFSGGEVRSHFVFLSRHR